MKKNLPLYKYYKKLQTEIYQLLNKSKVCFFKNIMCSKVIDAHTIAISSLNKISSLDKRLYVSKIDSPEELNDLKSNLFFIPKKESISKISTFKGFCGFHDKEIFGEIEDFDIIPSESQILKFHFRALAYNYYSKMSIEKILDSFKNAILPENHSVNPRFYLTLASASEHIPKIQKEIYEELENFKRAILSEKKIDLNYLFIRIDTIPELMCCETITPLYDFGSNFLLTKLKNDNDPVHYLIINVTSDAKGGFILLSWRKEFGVCNSLISSFQRNNYNLNQLFSYIFYKASNYAYSIDWWDNQSKNHKEQLAYFILTHFDRSLSEKEDETMRIISSDSKQYVKWNILEVLSSI